MEGRRPLEFSTLSEVMPEVDRLLAGHETVGNWNLGQICNHLSSAIIGSVDGYPYRLPWIIRKTVGPWIIRGIIRKRKFPTGIKASEKLIPKLGLDSRAEAEALRAAIWLFLSHTGPYASSPLNGPLTRETWEQFHYIHCAHHLGFVQTQTN